MTDLYCFYVYVREAICTQSITLSHSFKTVCIILCFTDADLVNVLRYWYLLRIPAVITAHPLLQPYFVGLGVRANFHKYKYIGDIFIIYENNFIAKS